MDSPIILAYVAWEPSWGAVDDLTFEVKRSEPMGPNLSHTLRFEAFFEDPPVFLAEVQRPADRGTLWVRWDDKNLEGAVITIDRDHTTGAAATLGAPVVGYIALRESFSDRSPP